jgi:hypothetical protein
VQLPDDIGIIIFENDRGAPITITVCNDQWISLRGSLTFVTSLRSSAPGRNPSPQRVTRTWVFAGAPVNIKVIRTVPLSWIRTSLIVGGGKLPLAPGATNIAPRLNG